MTDASAPCTVSHLYHHPDDAALAMSWSDRFHLVATSTPPSATGYYLWLADQVLALCHGARRGRVFVALEELERRSLQGGALARACGVRQGESLDVLDVMAGWGVDSLVLAARGCRVRMVETHAALAALAEDLVRRSGCAGADVVQGDGMAALEASPPVDVVYLDPMFPDRSKDALPGKRLQWLADLTAPDPRPLETWLRVAADRARRRVVLKRRRRDPAVLTPDWQISGRTVRYDVFRGRAEG